MVLATGGGVGYTPRAPGTAGSLVAIPIFVLLSSLGIAAYVGALVSLTLIGVWAAKHAELHFARKDDPRIVIDEVVGQLIALSPIVGWLSPLNLNGATAVMIAFVSFRLFDIWKPGPIGWIERNCPNSWGVMMDDVLAGTFVAIALLVTRCLIGVSW